jgi:hypothetical protein
MRILKTLILIYISVVGLYACISDDEFIESSEACLKFSVDSISFDTLISGNLSTTQSFWVYNTSNEHIFISSIHFEKEEQSCFRANVDGEALESGRIQGIELRANDSLCVFVDVTAPFLDIDSPIEHTDNLIFNLGSHLEQSVHLRVAGQDVIELKGWQVTDCDTLKGLRPYHVTDSLVVLPGATLFLEAGVTLLFSNDASLHVYGKLIAEGAPNADVVLRGDRFDDMFDNQPYDRIPGQWGGLHLYSQSYENQLNHVDIHSGRFGIRCDSADVSRMKLTLNNSIVHNVSEDCLYLRNVQTQVGNSQITNAGGNCLTIKGGTHSFVHCTIGQFYPFSAMRGNALNFTNFEGDQRFPLYKLDFQNCIITGYANDEIMGSSSDRYKDDAFNYSFATCLLNTPKYESEQIVDCLWEEDNECARADNFNPKFDTESLIFTFTLSPQSVAAGSANPQITANTFPYDRNGILRNAITPDMGCYIQNADSTTMTTSHLSY